uniref:Uncharacterized protein n=1 Tax=Magallana gigas TaxID=29159 RepID=K1RAN0_MAGGI
MLFNYRALLSSGVQVLGRIVLQSQCRSIRKQVRSGSKENGKYGLGNEESEEEESIEVEPGAGTDSANTQLPGGVVDKKGVVTENTMVKERGVVEEKIKID